MSMTDTIQLRIDASTKSKAQKILKDLGLDLSSAVKLFLTQVVSSRSIPFHIVTANGYTPAQEKKMLKEAAWAKKHGKRFSSAKEMLDDIMS